MKSRILQNAVDVRMIGVISAGLCAAYLFLLYVPNDKAVTVPIAAFVVVLVALIGAIALPAWKDDPKKKKLAAIVMCVQAVVVGIAGTAVFVAVD